MNAPLVEEFLTLQKIVKELMGGRMYPTTLAGLERAMKLLAK